MARCVLLPYAGIKGKCDKCGKALVGKQRRWCSKKCHTLYAKQHRWSLARAAARRRDKYKCVTCGSKENLEVNHITPRNGKGYGWGCHHHLSGLETLCRSCHLEVTRAQRASRKAVQAA